MILTYCRMMPARTLGYICTFGVVLFAQFGDSFAIKPLRIESIFASPSSYGQHDVIQKSRTAACSGCAYYAGQCTQ